MKQTAWKLGLYSKVLLAIIAVTLVGVLVGQPPGKIAAEEEPGEFDKVILTEALITEFMEKMRTIKSEFHTEALMPYISKEYFGSRWLDHYDFEVNSYDPWKGLEFRILEVKLPYVDVEIITGTTNKETAQLRFRVVREQNKVVLFPSRAQKTKYGNWVDPWWASTAGGKTAEDLHRLLEDFLEAIEERESKEEVAPPLPFIFENVTVWEVFKRDTGAILGTKLKGEVINQSGVTYKYTTRFQVTLYNRTGGVLGSGSFTLFGLRDSQRKSFEVTIYGADPADVKNWKIEFDRGS